jgi:hypothetical protein
LRPKEIFRGYSKSRARTWQTKRVAATTIPLLIKMKRITTNSSTKTKQIKLMVNNMVKISKRRLSNKLLPEMNR